MTEKPTDEHAHDGEDVICEVCLGQQIASALALTFNGMPPSLAYNVLGSLVSGIFSIVEFAEPQHALEEFDHWAKYTRERLAEVKKGKMQ
jgi:hypothetical protein